MGSNLITPKQLIADAKGKERFMPSDIAFDCLEEFATKGCRFDQIENMREGCVLTRTADGWQITAPRVDAETGEKGEWKLKSKSLAKLLDKAGL